MSNGQWQPILEGPLADRARQAVEVIAEDLQALELGPDAPASLAGGAAGIALCASYLAGWSGRSARAAATASARRRARCNPS